MCLFFGFIDVFQLVRRCLLSEYLEVYAADSDFCMILNVVAGRV